MNSQTALADLIADLGQPAQPVKPAGPPCLDPWCGNGPKPCGHTPDQHMAHHGAAAILAGEPTTTQASARIAAAAPTRHARHTEDRGSCTCHADNSLYGTLTACPACGHRSFDPAAQACERRGCGHATAPTATPRPEGPPPSTVAEMRDVLTNLDANRPRSQQTSLGPSELGTPCQRQIAMKLAGLPRQPDKRPPWAAMQGTAMHGLMENALRFHNQQLGRERWVIEERLRIDDEIFGHGDAYDTDTDTVVDWKYVGVTARRKSARKTVPNDQLVSPDYRVQGHLYGLGHERAGRDVRWVRLVLLARSHDYDDSTEWTEAYDPFLAHKALRRYHDTKKLLTVLPAWQVAADPGKACDWCPFKRPGGPADATGCPGNLDQTSKANQELLANM